MKPLCVTIQMKAIEGFFHVVLFIKLYKVVLTLFVDKTQVCNHSNGSYTTVLSRGTVYYAVEVISLISLKANP